MDIQSFTLVVFLAEIVHPKGELNNFSCWILRIAATLVAMFSSDSSSSTLSTFAEQTLLGVSVSGRLYAERLGTECMP